MKKVNKLTAILLSTLLLFSMCSVAFCSGAEQTVPTYAAANQVDTQYPLVILPGINHSVSYVANEDGSVALDEEGNELSGGLLILNKANLVNKLLKKLLWPVLSSLFMQFDNGLSDAAYEVVCDLFSLQGSDNDGVQINNLKTESYNYPVSKMNADTKDWFYRMLPMQKVSAKIGEDNIYLFTFPLIGDPMQSAKELVKYIDMVKAQKGVDKVNIATVSLGGTILTAYADIIDGDWSNVNSIINVVSLLNGTDIIADFYAREWNLSDEYLYSEYIKNVMLQTNGSTTLGCVINAALRIFSRKTVEALLSGAYQGILDTLLVNCPQFWAMVPSQRYDVLADKYLSDKEHAVMKAKTDAFQTARLNLEANLLEANKQGVAINNICGSDLDYDDGDYCFLGIVASTATCNSDGIIPVYSTSLGATSMPKGQSFSTEYLSKAELNGTAKYISPLKSVDASTCLFPDHVWFFVGQHHEIGTDDVAIELLSRILTGEVTDINSSDTFPQFCGFRNTKRLTRWLLEEAEAVMNNTEGQYSEEQIAQVKEAYDEAIALLSEYKLDENSDEQAVQATAKLDAALINAGVREAEKVNWYDSVLEKATQIGDSFLLKLFGGKGFFDWNHIGDLNGKIFGK